MVTSSRTLGASFQRVRQQRSGVENVLHVVDDHEHLAAGQVGDQRSLGIAAVLDGSAEGSRDRKGDVALLLHRRQTNRNTAVGERFDEVLPARERDSSLPAAAHPRHRQQPHLARQHRSRLRQFSFAPDQSIGQRREIRALPRESLRRRELVRSHPSESEVEQPTRQREVFQSMLTEVVNGNIRYELTRRCAQQHLPAMRGSA